MQVNNLGRVRGYQGESELNQNSMDLYKIRPVSDTIICASRRNSINKNILIEVNGEPQLIVPSCQTLRRVTHSAPIHLEPGRCYNQGTKKSTENLTLLPLPQEREEIGQLSSPTYATGSKNVPTGMKGGILPLFQ